MKIPTKDWMTRKRVRMVLEDSRSMMNTSGLHWTRGAFVAMRRKLHGGRRVEVLCYCSVGAIQQATKSQTLRDHALIALANVVDPERMAQAEQDMDSKRLGFGLAPLPKKERRRRMAQWAHGAIIEWNDSGSRRWEHVDKAFREAAS